MDISKIQIESGTYNIKDTEARNSINTLESNVNEQIDNLEQANNNLSSQINNLLKNNSFNSLNMKRISRSLELIANDYYQMQGCVYCDNDIMVRALIANNPDNVNNVKIQKFNMSSMTILSEKIINNGGHANWLSYNSNNNEIYITPLSLKQNDTDVVNNNIIVLDFNTLNVKRYISLPTTQQIMSFTYDKISQKYYAITSSNIVYEYVNNSLNIICTLENINTPYSERLDGYETYLMQGANILDGIVYYSSMNPYGLALFDLSTGKLKAFYNYNNIVNDRFLIREVEEITPDENGNIIIGTYGLESPSGEYGMSQFFKANIITSIGENNPSFNPPTSRTITVDFANTDPNPVGSVNNPFKTIGEALDCINTPYFKGATILVKNGTYPFFYLNSPNTNITIAGESKDNTIIRGIKSFNTKLFLRSLKINNDFNKEYNCYFSNSDIKLRDIILKENNHHTIYCTSSKLDYRYLYFNSDGNYADMFTNKHIIDINFGSSILCRDDKSPLFQFNDQSNILLKPVCFCDNFSYYYGSINAPNEFMAMFGNKSIKQIIPEITSSQSVNERKLVPFFNNGVNSGSLKATYNRCSNNAGVTSEMNIDYTASSLSISSNRVCVMKSSGNTITVKSDNTPDYDYIRLINIFVN